MSTILKALRRVEEERSAQAPRPLREEVAARPTQRAASSWLAAGLALVAGIGVGVALLRFRADPQPQVRAALTPPAESAAPEPSGRPAAGAVTKAPDRVAPAESATGERPALARSRSVPRDLPSAAAPPRLRERASLPPEALASDVKVVERVAAAAPPAVTEPQPAALPPPEATPAPARPEPAAVASAPPAPKARSATRNSVAAAPESRVQDPAPTLAPERSSVARAALPELLVTRTIWHPLAERRIAILSVEGRDAPLHVREGDAIGPLIVESIEPSGVVFQHDGVELRRRVGAP